MSDYTPTTEQVREQYADASLFPGLAGYNFDRWLAAHDEQFRFDCGICRDTRGGVMHSFNGHLLHRRCIESAAQMLAGLKMFESTGSE